MGFESAYGYAGFQLTQATCCGSTWTTDAFFMITFLSGHGSSDSRRFRQGLWVAYSPVEVLQIPGGFGSI